MKTRIATFITSTSLLLSACATGYAPHSFWNDGGFSETQVQPGLWQVRFQGNEMTSPERTEDFARLRAAELCLSQGRKFMYLGEVATRVAQTGYLPGSTTSTTTGSASAYGYGNYANAYGSATTTTYSSPGVAFYSPKTGLSVACSTQKGESAWDAEFLVQSLRSKYGIKPKTSSTENH